MSLFHSFLAESYHQRQIRLKFLHLLFNFLTDCYDLTHRPVFEVLVCCDHTPETFLYKFFSCIRVNCVKLIIHPDIYVCVPTMHNRPQSIVRNKVFCNTC